MAIEIERKEHTAEELRRLACRVSDPDQARRMLAIALVMEGSDRTTAARSCGMVSIGAESCPPIGVEL